MLTILRTSIGRLGLAALGLAAGCAGGEPASGPGDGSVDGAVPTGGLISRLPNPSCLAPAQAPETGLAGLPLRLSETGCFEPSDPTRPLPALIPYQVNAPLWSDGAEKDRWLALPDGARIHVNAEGDFVLPAGTVTVKTFRFGARRVETRFFVRHPGGEWSGYTYEWNLAGTDAVLLAEGRHRRRIDERDWDFPSRSECKQCHTQAAGDALGLELAQLDGEFTYPDGHRANQLATWSHLGLFDAPLAAPDQRPPPLPLAGAAGVPLELRARAYLHANCSNCHRPEVDNSGSVDLRFATPLAATMGCDTRPTKGAQGFGPQVRIIAPGNPDLSMLVLRMKILGAGRMPEVASLLVDEDGVGLLSEWIRSLAACR